MIAWDLKYVACSHTKFSYLHIYVACWHNLSCMWGTEIRHHIYVWRIFINILQFGHCEEDDHSTCCEDNACVGNTLLFFCMKNVMGVWGCKIWKNLLWCYKSTRLSPQFPTLFQLSNKAEQMSCSLKSCSSNNQGNC